MVAVAVLEEKQSYCPVDCGSFPGRLRDDVRFRRNADTTTIFVRDGWLVIESVDRTSLDKLLAENCERLLTVAEVNERIGFTPGAVRNWIKRSILPAIRVGREYRIREAELAKFLEGNYSERSRAATQLARSR